MAGLAGPPDTECRFCSGRWHGRTAATLVLYIVRSRASAEW